MSGGAVRYAVAWGRQDAHRPTVAHSHGTEPKSWPSNMYVRDIAARVATEHVQHLAHAARAHSEDMRGGAAHARVWAHHAAMLYAILYAIL